MKILFLQTVSNFLETYGMTISSRICFAGSVHQTFTHWISYYFTADVISQISVH